MPIIAAKQTIAKMAKKAINDFVVFILKFSSDLTLRSSLLRKKIKNENAAGIIIAMSTIVIKSVRKSDIIPRLFFVRLLKNIRILLIGEKVAVALHTGRSYYALL